MHMYVYIYIYIYIYIYLFISIFIFILLYTEASEAKKDSIEAKEEGFESVPSLHAFHIPAKSSHSVCVQLGQLLVCDLLVNDLLRRA